MHKSHYQKIHILINLHNLFLWYLSTSFVKKGILNQPLGEPREQHLGHVPQKVQAILNFINEMTGRVDIIIINIYFVYQYN